MSELAVCGSGEGEQLEGDCQIGQGIRSQSNSALPFSAAMSQLLDKLSTLLPAVRVWVEWMVCHTELWNKPASSEEVTAV